jgi:demethylmenaquinone methyltransferase/2-methoxy-6-polyprenyl-1,4-benzoquinol methylase
MKLYRFASSLLYGAIAGIYDVLDVALFRPPARNPRMGLARALPPEIRSVIDLCTGTGASSLAIAKSDEARRVVGVDLSTNMLGIASRKAKKAKVRNIELRRMDATATDFPSASFDAVTTSLSLHELPLGLRDRLMREMRRLVADHGRLYIIEWERPRRGLARSMFGIFPMLVEPRGFREFLSLDWEDFLSKYGFELVQSESFSFTRLLIARVIEEQ